VVVFVGGGEVAVQPARSTITMQMTGNSIALFSI